MNSMPFISLSILGLGALMLVFGYAPTRANETLPLPEPGEMTFRWSRNGGNCGSCTWLSAEGRITSNTPDRLRTFLGKPTGRGTAPIFLHSPGGSLSGGLLLGQVLREYGFRTEVGKTVLSNLGDGAPKDLAEVISGACESSCAWAFLGGITRTVSEGSKLGFHQFYRVLDADARISEALKTLDSETPKFSSDQMISGLLVEYLQIMEVDTRVLQISANAGPDEMTYPDSEMLEELGIVTRSGLGDWDLEPYRNGLVVFARESDPSELISQVTVFCRGRDDVVIMGTSEPHHQGGPFFEPSPGRENDWWPGFELEIDDIKFRISHRRIVERQSDDGPHYAQASLTVTEVKALLEARSFKLYYATPRYLGYRATSGKLSAKDRASLAVTLRNCVN